MIKIINAVSVKGQKINLPFEVELPDTYINWDSSTYIMYILLTIINKFETRLAEVENKLKEIKND